MDKRTIMPTLIIHEPSRFDRSNNTPFCSTAGEWFLRELDKYDNGNRTVLSLEPFQRLGGFRCPDVAGFTHILAVGDKPRVATIGNRIPPGYAITKLNGARLLATFDPQVAHDFQHEDDDEDDGEDQSNKDITATRHANFRYWIQVHIDKLFNPRPVEPQPAFLVKPTLAPVTQWLLELSNSFLYLDIETRGDFALHCIGIAGETGPIYCVPFWLYNGALAYEQKQLFAFWRALNIAASRNTLVIHNSMFDLAVLCHQYRFIGARRVYDTMIAQHRIAPEAEKSLAHCIAQHTEMPFHKDQFVHPSNPTQQDQLWQYNCRDVWAMRLIRREQVRLAEKFPGMLDSINEGNKLVFPLLVNSLRGLAVNEARLKTEIDHARRVCEQLYRILHILVGYKINAGSWQQLGVYLYDQMGYAVPFKSETGNRSTNVKALYSLLVKTANPAIKVILKLRKAQKLYSSLNFKPYHGIP